MTARHIFVKSVCRWNGVVEEKSESSKKIAKCQQIALLLSSKPPSSSCKVSPQADFEGGKEKAKVE